MKISKREARILTVVIIALSGISFVFAGNEGVPFDELREAIVGVQEDIVNAVTSGLIFPYTLTQEIGRTHISGGVR